MDPIICGLHLVKQMLEGMLQVRLHHVDTSIRMCLESVDLLRQGLEMPMRACVRCFELLDLLHQVLEHVTVRDGEGGRLSEGLCLGTHVTWYLGICRPPDVSLEAARGVAG